jgi:hypothetical protein
MLLHHLLCGLLFGALVAVACLCTGVPSLSALAAFVIASNLGLGARLV